MKGQVLIITAIIMVLVLFLIKVEMSYTGSYEFSDTSNINIFDNIRNELRRSGEIAIWKDNYSAVYRFSEFLKSDRDVDIFYSISDFKGTSLNITLVNLLNESMENVQVSQNLTDETDSPGSLGEGESGYVNFTHSPGAEEMFEINVSYTGSESGDANRTFSARAGPSRYVTVFYDFRMKYDGSYISDRFQISGKG